VDLPTFILAERITGTVSPADANPTEPPRPGVLHYLATMYREGRSFATHLSVPVGDPPGLDVALRLAAERARRVEHAPTHEEWLRAAGIRDRPDDPLEVGAAHAGEVELWHRAQLAEAQALRAFLGEVAYRELMEAIAPIPPARETAPDAPRAQEARSDRGGRSVRRWWMGALVWGVVLALPLVLVRRGAGTRRGARSPLRRFIPA